MLPSQDWRPPVLALMRAYAARTPGALVEEKSAGLAWHYRLADPALGPSRAQALTLELSLILDRLSAEILPGSKVIEVVPRGIHKGRLVPSVVTRAPAGALVVAIGDDRTDEDLFAALPPERPGHPCRTRADDGRHPHRRCPRGSRASTHHPGSAARLSRDALS